VGFDGHLASDASGTFSGSPFGRQGAAKFFGTIPFPGLPAAGSSPNSACGEAAKSSFLASGEPPCGGYHAPSSGGRSRPRLCRSLQFAELKFFFQFCRVEDIYGPHPLA
jgi:hypothetical protein